MFGDVAGIGDEKRDGVGQVITNFSALNVSDPTTFGMWRLGGDASETVYNAIKAGYRRFDSACDYGNEVLTGRGIRRAIADGIVKRDELYITTKLWNTYHDPNHVSLALDRCLHDLGLCYVDEFLIHFPISMEVSLIRSECVSCMASKLTQVMHIFVSLYPLNRNILLSGRI